MCTQDLNVDEIYVQIRSLTNTVGDVGPVSLLVARGYFTEDLLREPITTLTDVLRLMTIRGVGG